MKYNLVRHEFRLTARSWLIGGIVILFFMAIFVSYTDIIIGNTDLIRVMESMPEALLKSFGFEFEMLNTFEGWMASEPFTFFSLLLSVFSAVWASVTLSKEQDQLTGEFLFSLPYSRVSIFLSKVVTHWLQVTSIYILSFAVVMQLGYLMSEINHLDQLFLLFTGGYFVSLAYAGIGFVLTVLISSERAAMSLGIGIALVSFLLKMLSTLSEEINWLANFSLYQLFDNKEILESTTLSISGICISLGIYVLGILLGLILFKIKKIAV
jgi:ABC-type transport system involved in multi-copper enzyme maturation permease subunit